MQSSAEDLHRIAMEQTYIRHVELLGFEKRFFPSQHYVYMMIVKWSDLTEKMIYRKYSEIHTFHKALKEMFPIEAGQIDSKDRIIPALPAPKWVDSQRATETRQDTLVEYCRSLVGLPPHISRCSLVCLFFRVRPEDENPPAPGTLKRNETFVDSREKSRDTVSEISGPIVLDTYRIIADFNKTSKYEIDLRTGDLVDIVEKSSNGWWFCQCEAKRGWVPASYLEPLDGPEEPEEADPNYEGELYVTIRTYTADQEDEITLERGECIEVIHKLLDGWWVVRKGEETGHFPSMFLVTAGKKDTSESESNITQRQKPPPRRSTIRNPQSIHSRGRRRLSQDVYRRNSRRFTQQRQKVPTESPLRERRNHDNIPESPGSDAEEQKRAPAIPPRPSAELIMERCTDNTRKRVSIRKASTED